MKTLKNIFSVLLAVIAMTTVASCSDDPEYTPAENEGVKSHVYFAGSSSQTIEVEPGVTSFELTLERQDATDAQTVELSVTANEDNKFVCPATASFAAGEATTKITINLSSPEEGKYYSFAVQVAGEDLSSYTQGYREKKVSFAIMKWESIGEGYWVGNAVIRFFGVDQLPMKVAIEKAVTTTETRFRFASPYARTASVVGNIGESDYEWFDGYPYNDPADVVAGEYTFLIICDSKGNASLTPTNMGMDWGYGMFSTGSIYPSVSSNIASYPLGTYDKDAGTVSFPVNSLYVSMANYNNGSKYPTTLPACLYLSDDAFINNQSKEVDYEEDFTWNAVAKSAGFFESTAVQETWIQEVEIAKEQEEGATTILYRFPSLYADGANIVFFHDTKENMLSMPKAQLTGMISIGGADVYMDLKSGSVSENNVFTMNIDFYTLGSDGKKASELGTVTETFSWGYTGTAYQDLLPGKTVADYTGNWVAPVLNLSTGATGNVLVTITPMDGEPNAVVIKGLSALSNYDDSVIATYEADGMLYLGAQNAQPFSGYDVILSMFDINSPGSFDLNNYLIGGITADGKFAFVDAPDNSKTVNSVRFLALQNGSPYSWINSYVPYKMEWAPYVPTRATEQLISSKAEIMPLDNVQERSGKTIRKNFGAVKSAKTMKDNLSAPL